MSAVIIGSVVIARALGYDFSLVELAALCGLFVTYIYEEFKVGKP